MVTLAQKFQKAQAILNLLEINEEHNASIFLFQSNFTIHLEYSKSLEDLISTKLIVLSHDKFCDKFCNYVVFRCGDFDIFLNVYKK